MLLGAAVGTPRTLFQLESSSLMIVNPGRYNRMSRCVSARLQGAEVQGRGGSVQTAAHWWSRRRPALCSSRGGPLSVAWPSPARACSFTPLCLAEAHRGCSAPARLLRGEPQVFCTSSARAEPKAAALRRIAAKPAPSALGPACCCCCCFGCCFGCCFAVLPALCTFDFRAFDGVSTSRFAQAALRTANCWNAGDPAMHAHRPNQRRVVRVDRQSRGHGAMGPRR